MIPVPAGVRVWLATGHTDMRKGFPSLSLRSANRHAAGPRGGHFLRISRVSASSIRSGPFAHAAVALAFASWARMRPRAWSACRHSGRRSCMSERSLPAANAIRSFRLPRSRIRFSRGRAGPHLLAEIVFGKYRAHQSLNRQSISTKTACEPPICVRTSLRNVAN